MAKKNQKIIVQGREIGISKIDDMDFICLTDMIRGEEGKDHIRNWMRSRNTVEFIGLWETIHNPDFKGVEFDTFKKEAGLNSFNLTPQKWIESTNAKGLISRSGRAGGTYAHEDIAFEFAIWISPAFKLYLIKEFQRLKKWENDRNRLEWNARRLLAKIGYELQTDAIQRNIIPVTKIPKGRRGIIFADEAEVLNIALFGMSAKEWREQNPDKHLIGQNMGDDASIAQLLVLNNLEAKNADMIDQGIAQGKRMAVLRETAVNQLRVFINDYRIQKLESGDVNYVLELPPASVRHPLAKDVG